MNKSIRQSEQDTDDSRVADYLANRLEAEALQRFELELIGSPKLQEQLRQAYVLQQLLREQPDAIAASPPRTRPAPLGLALAAGLGALAVGLPAAWWMQRNDAALSALAQSHAELQQRFEQLGSIQLGVPSLRLGNVRSNPDAALPLLRSTPELHWVRVTVPAAILEQPPGPRLALSLLDPDGQQQWHSSGERWQLDGDEYALLLPLGVLKPGRHELLLAAGDGSQQRLAFEVAPPEQTH